MSATPPAELSPRRWQDWWVTGLGAGFVPWAPGTVASVVGMLSFDALWPLLPAAIGWLLLPLAWWAGARACARAAQRLGLEDPPALAVDELVAMWTLLAALQAADLRLGPGLQGQVLVQLCALAWFRFFDILKPGPVGWADQRVHGGLGIMLDDAVAAVLAAMATWLSCLGWTYWR